MAELSRLVASPGKPPQQDDHCNASRIVLGTRTAGFSAVNLFVADPPDAALAKPFSGRDGYRSTANQFALAAACGLLAFCLARTAVAQVLRDPPTPFGPLVYNDEFFDPSALTGISDGLKNVQLGDMPGWYVNLGGSLRERVESFSNSVFGFRQAGGVRNEDYILHRLLLSGDFHFGP
jgi:hypothetical protein